jgi:hypothetical protein
MLMQKIVTTWKGNRGIGFGFLNANLIHPSFPRTPDIFAAGRFQLRGPRHQLSNIATSEVGV